MNRISMVAWPPRFSFSGSLHSGFLLGDSSRETFNPHRRSLMHTPRNDLVTITSVDLEGHLPSVGVNDPRAAKHGSAQWSRGQVTEFDLEPDASLAGFEKGLHRLARGLLQESNQIGRAEHGRHAIGGEVNDMFLFHDELKLTGGADFRARSHTMVVWQKYFLKAASVVLAASAESGYGKASAET